MIGEKGEHIIFSLLVVGLIFILSEIALGFRLIKPISEIDFTAEKPTDHSHFAHWNLNESLRGRVSTTNNMKYPHREIVSALRTAMRESMIRWIFGIAWLLGFLLMLAIPLRAIPGNTITLQASIYRPRDYILLGTLALLSALVIALQFAIIKSGVKSRTGHAAGGVGIISGVFSSLFASASCGLCVGALFSFVGFNTILFFVEYRYYIVFVSMLLLVLSLYLLARRFNEGCTVCLVAETGA